MGTQQRVCIIERAIFQWKVHKKSKNNFKTRSRKKKKSQKKRFFFCFFTFQFYRFSSTFYDGYVFLRWVAYFFCLSEKTKKKKFFSLFFNFFQFNFFESELVRLGPKSSENIIFDELEQSKKKSIFGKKYFWGSTFRFFFFLKMTPRSPL